MLSNKRWHDEHQPRSGRASFPLPGSGARLGTPVAVFGSSHLPPREDRGRQPSPRPRTTTGPERMSFTTSTEQAARRERVCGFMLAQVYPAVPASQAPLAAA